MATGTTNLATLFQDPNFLALLAGVGTQLDPEGVGGAIGRPTSALIQNRAAQNAVATGDRQRQATNLLTGASLLPEGSPERAEFTKRAIDMLGLTVPGQEGLTSVAMTPKGSLKLEVDPPAPLNAQGPYSTETSAPAATNPAPSPTPPRRSPLSAIVPFYSAPVGSRLGR